MFGWFVFFSLDSIEKALSFEYSAPSLALLSSDFCFCSQFYPSVVQIENTKTLEIKEFDCPRRKKNLKTGGTHSHTRIQTANLNVCCSFKCQKSYNDCFTFKLISSCVSFSSISFREFLISMPDDICSMIMIIK